MRELQQAGRGGGGAYGGGGGAYGNGVGQSTPVTTLGGGGGNGGGSGGNSGEQPLRSSTLRCISQDYVPAAARPISWQLPLLWLMHAPHGVLLQCHRTELVQAPVLTRWLHILAGSSGSSSNGNSTNSDDNDSGAYLPSLVQ